MMRIDAIAGRYLVARKLAKAVFAIVAQQSLWRVIVSNRRRRRLERVGGVAHAMSRTVLPLSRRARRHLAAVRIQSAWRRHRCQRRYRLARRGRGAWLELRRHQSVAAHVRLLRREAVARRAAEEAERQAREAARRAAEVHIPLYARGGAAASS
jgi:hypothetical protein